MFLKLTKTIINTHMIRKIVIEPNKYYIHLIKHDISGTIIIGSGTIFSQSEEIKVCKENDRVDYYRLENFIEKIRD